MAVAKAGSPRGSATGPPGADGSEPPSVDSIAVDAYQVPSWILLSLNHKKPQFADLKVRQALSTSIDREAINNAIYSGLGTVPNSVLPQQRYDADTNEIPAIK